MVVVVTYNRWSMGFLMVELPRFKVSPTINRRLAYGGPTIKIKLGQQCGPLGPIRERLIPQRVVLLSDLTILSDYNNIILSCAFSQEIRAKTVKITFRVACLGCDVIITCNNVFLAFYSISAFG
jgi:hypothetical protein